MFLVGGTGLGAKRDTVSKTVSLFQAFCWERLSRCICFSHSALDKRLEMVLSEKDQVSWARSCKVSPEMRYTVQSDMGSAPRDR